MIQCNEGHFYDETRYPACPYCSTSIDGGMGSAAKTVALQRQVPGPGAGEANPTLPLRPADQPAASAAPKTVRLMRPSAAAIDPVVGWLVAIEGPETGQDFRLHSEKNFVGRDASMDVSLSRDEAVSRQKHATVVFEPQKQQFWLLPGDESGLVYLNGEAAYVPVRLNPNDILQLGKTKLVLVAFVNEAFSWPH
jgi:hypothetical protein